jgi:hypothetical protein
MGKQVYYMVFLGMLSLLLGYNTFAKTNPETIVVGFYENRLGRYEIEIIKKEKDVYLPLISIFDILRLKNDLSPDRLVVKGYIIDKDSTFVIDINKNEAKYRKQKYEISQNDYISTSKEIYFKENILKLVFGFDIKYDERRVEVVLKSKLQFPGVKEQQRQRSYKKQLEKTYVEPELVLGRSSKFFSLGKIGYYLNSQKTINKSFIHSYRFNLGSQILGGDLEASVRGIINKPIKQRDLSGKLLYPFFGNRYVSQVTIGDIQRRSYVGGQLFGVDITNSPAERRSLFGDIEYSVPVKSKEELLMSARAGYPLYVAPQNDTIITKKDPLFYGYTNLVMQKFDWYGQEIFQRRFVIVPSTMLPQGDLDYKMSIGKLRQKDYPLYGGLDLNYGATSNITLGAGVEYTDRARLKEKIYPYTSSTFRISDNIYSTAEFSPFVRSQAALTWEAWDQKRIDIQHQIYARNSVFNPREIKNTSSLSINLPFSSNSTSFILSGTFTKNILKVGSEDSYNLNAGASFRRLSISYNNTRYKQEGIGTLLFNSQLGIVINATSFSSISLNGVYDHLNDRLRNTTIGINLPITSIFMVNIFVDRSFIQQDITAVASISIRPPFISSNTSAIKSASGVTYHQTLSGEILGSSETFDVLFRNHSDTRQGYFLTHTFFDENNNGKMDKGEKYIKNTGITTERSGFSSGGFSQKYDDETYFSRGDYYRDYVFRVKTKDLEEPFLAPLYDGISIKAEPNKLKTVNIPILNGGIVKGVINLKDGSPATGVTVLMTNQNIKSGVKNSLKTTKTNSHGEFEFPAVPPGSYKVYLDTDEISKAGYVAEPDYTTVEVTGESGKEYIDVMFALKQK